MNNTIMFFRADWETKAELQSFLSDYAGNCADLGCESTEDGYCLCKDVVVNETPAFTVLDDVTVEDILSTATFGGFEPDGAFASVPGNENIKIFPDAPLTSETLFEVTDYNGIRRIRKNMKSKVSFGSGRLSFRNPVHFMELDSFNERDAQYEIDAALEHYFYHHNTAPFLAIRIAQRFGMANPSPRLVDIAATAFRTGIYVAEGSQKDTVFGSGEYGSMEALVSAIVLDRESQNFLLDKDPSHGALGESYLKLVRVLRSLEYAPSVSQQLLRTDRDLEDFIGQEAYKVPSVFSFFKPEFQPVGRIQQAGLVSPEAQILTGPKSVNLVNMLLSYSKYGLNGCYEGVGYGVRDRSWDEDECVLGNTPRNEGEATYIPSSNNAADIVDELSLLLTSGRLSSGNRQIIIDAYEDTIAAGKSETEAIINAQQLFIMTPEFNANGSVEKTGEPRNGSSDLPPPANEYKAVIFVMLEGGMDSYNLLVPKEGCSVTNADGKTSREQYDSERGVMAFDWEGSEGDLTISEDPLDGQPCSTFAIHEKMTVLKELYDEGSLSFFANTGVINNAPMTKSDYNDVTVTQLFAHNAMQEESKKIDPYNDKTGTGVFGRTKDILHQAGYNVNTISIDNPSIALEGVPGSGAVPTNVVNQAGVKLFGRRPEEEDYFDIVDYAEQLNSELTSSSNWHGDTFSESFLTGIDQSSKLSTYLDSVTLGDAWEVDPNGWHEDVAHRSWSMVARLMETRTDRNVDRDFFSLRFGDWDHHNAMKENLQDSLQGLNYGLERMVAHLKATGTWDNTAIVVTSDFARTITPNDNDGSDHAWGGNYFMLGGGVKGGRIRGKYPDDITLAGSLNIGRGRVIPTTSWDSIFNAVVEWTGVDGDADLDYCLPNRNSAADPAGGFPLYSKDDLFTPE